MNVYIVMVKTENVYIELGTYIAASNTDIYNAFRQDWRNLDVELIA